MAAHDLLAGNYRVYLGFLGRNTVQPHPPLTQERLCPQAQLDLDSDAEDGRAGYPGMCTTTEIGKAQTLQISGNR